MADPLLSITVLNYNYAHYLPTCLDSILAQTFRDFEVLLINDKSTDNSLDVIRPYLGDPRIRLIDHEKNQGFSRSLKEGSEGSKSKYMTVVSADDWILDPTAFEKQVALLERDDQIAFAFTNYGCYRSEKECTYVVNPAPESYVRPGIDVFSEVILRQTTPLHSGTVIRRTAYEKIGGYDLVTRYASDARMWAGLCHAGKVGYINEILFAYRIHENNMSKGKDVVKRSIEEDLAIIEWSFGLMSPGERVRYRGLYKRAVKKTLSTYPVFFTFRENNPRLGWYFVWVGTKLRPVETLLQPTTLALALRSVLGSRGYEFIEKGRALFSRSTRERLRRQARPANG